jgi:hypothetical protein
MFVCEWTSKEKVHISSTPTRDVSEWVPYDSSIVCLIENISGFRRLVRHNIMAKKTVRAICIYCGNVDEVTEDHVIPKCLFPKGRPGDIPKVNACKVCNNAAKSVNDRCHPECCVAIRRRKKGNHLTALLFLLAASMSPLLSSSSPQLVPASALLSGNQVS